MQPTGINSCEIMTWDLWDPPHIQVAPESGINVQCGCQHDFHGGYDVDLLEENAANEMACVQALQILVRKADDEIDELEKHLVCLQSELACVEYEEWPNICCNALKEKIDHFHVSLKRLRCRDQDDSGAHSNVNDEPAERTHDMVKALLRSYCHEKNQKREQFLQTVEGSSSTDAVDYSSAHSNSDEKQWEESHPKALISEPSSTSIKSSSSSALRDETTCNGNMIKVCEPKLEVSDDVEHGNGSAINRSRILNQPLKLQESTAKSDEPSDATTEYTVPDPSIDDGGCNRRTKTSNTAALPENNRNPDKEPIYSDQMLKIALNYGKEEPKDALTKKQALPISSLFVRGETRNSDTESSALTSLVELEDQKSEHVMKTDPGEEDKVSTAVKLLDDASVADRSNLICSKRPQKQKYKREIEQYENVSSPKRSQQVEIAPSASLSKTIGGRMSGIVNECANVNKPPTGKILNELVLAINSEAKSPALAPDVSAGLVYQQQGKRQKTSNTATSMRVTHARVKLGDLEAEVSGSGCKAEPLMIKHEKSDDLHNKLGILRPPAEISLESLKVNDLRAIAKEHKLKNYHKLKKKLLVEQISNTLGRC